MLINRTITLPAVDTGYSLYDLLKAEEPNLRERVAGLRLQTGPAGTTYLVPNPGGYTSTTGNVPDDYGWRIDVDNPYQVDQHPANQISLTEYYLGTDAAGTLVHVHAYLY